MDEFSLKSNYEFIREVHSALRYYHSVEESPKFLLDNLILIQIERQKQDLLIPSTLRLTTNKILLNSINKLVAKNFEAARVLRKRFVEKKPIIVVSQDLNLSQDQVKRRQKKGIIALTEIILAQEREARRVLVNQLEGILAHKTHTKLFGVEETIDSLVHQLLSIESPWIVSLRGVGGIGKTTLATESVRNIIRQFRYENIVWIDFNKGYDENRISMIETEQMYEKIILDISSQLNQTPRKDFSFSSLEKFVRQILKRSSSLIVIDNIEETDNTSFLLSKLIDLANPSRFFLISRNKLPHHYHPEIATFVVKQLDREDAIKLIQYFAIELGLNSLTTSETSDLEKINHHVGGNPYALKIIVSMLSIRSMNDVLDDLVEVQSEDIKLLYSHIFKKSWETLGDAAKTLLITMPLALEKGITSEQMSAASGLNPEEIWPAIQELVSLSLLDVHGDAWERRYSIHQLLESFLRSNYLELYSDSQPEKNHKSIETVSNAEQSIKKSSNIKSGDEHIAYVIARIRREDENKIFIGSTIIVEAGVWDEELQHFTDALLNLPTNNLPIEFQLIINGEDMDYISERTKVFTFDSKNPSPLVECFCQSKSYPFGR